jgi:hypothetical protein
MIHSSAPPFSRISPSYTWIACLWQVDDRPLRRRDYPFGCDHHHWVWANLIAPHPVSIVREAEIDVIDVD